jgi:hypothetical protein
MTPPGPADAAPEDNMKRMLLLICLASLALGARPTLADFPRLIHYQGIITDSAGVPITDPSVSVRYLLYTQEVGGAFFWAEVTQVPVVDGRVDHLLGSLTAMPDSIFTKIDSLWLELLVNGEVLSPRTLLTPAPYAMRVATVDQAKGGDVFGDIWLHSDLTVGDFMGNAGRILVYNGSLATVDIRGAESAVEGADIQLRKTNTWRSIELDAEEANVGHIRLYHERPGGGEVKTVDLAASSDGTLGSQMLLYPSSGSGHSLHLNAEYGGGGATGGPRGEGRIGVNAEPDSGAVQVHSGGKFGAYITNDYSSSSFPKVVYARYTGTATVGPVGVWGEGHPADGNGTGGIFIGGEDGIVATAKGGAATWGCIAVSAHAEGSGGNGTRYGVLANASGGETNYGVFASASGGTDNWAAWISGKGHASQMAVATTDIPVGYALAVGGKLLCEEVEVMLETDWPDYVFKEDYPLLTLEDLERKIDVAGHLPGLPSADEVETGGVALGAMQAKLLEKVEELTLHLIAMNKDLKAVRSENESLRSRLDQLESTP